MSRDVSLTALYWTTYESTSVVDSLHSGMSDTRRLSRPYSGTVQHKERQSSVQLQIPVAWKESSVGAGRWLLPPPVRDHPFTGLPSADIAAFHLSEEGQLLLGSSLCECEGRAGNGNAVVCDGVEICWRFDSGHDRQYAPLMAVDWQKINYFDCLSSKKVKRFAAFLCFIMM